MDNMDSEGITYETQTYWLSCTIISDMLCHQKVTGMGGACKVMEMVVPL